MKKKINKCINDSYESYADFSSSKAVVLLEELFDKETLDFISFLRENYSEANGWSDTLEKNNVWCNDRTYKRETTEEIYETWKKS